MLLAVLSNRTSMMHHFQDFATSVVLTAIDFEDEQLFTSVIIVATIAMYDFLPITIPTIMHVSCADSKTSDVKQQL